MVIVTVVIVLGLIASAGASFVWSGASSVVWSVIS
jgi:hypothetical protein